MKYWTGLTTYLVRGTWLLAVALLVLAVAAPAYAAADYFDPVGTHDRADCSILAGWAKDGDTTLPIQVHVYKGGPYPYGTFVTAVVANRYRGDLPFADKNHGFSIATPSAFFTGCREKVYIHAIDVDTNGNPVPGGNNVLLNLTGKTIRCGPFNPECFEKPWEPPIYP
jgi:hypothetical protein